MMTPTMQNTNLDTLESALNLLAQILEQSPVTDEEADMAQEIERLRANQAEAKQALDEATTIMRSLLTNTKG